MQIKTLVSAIALTLFIGSAAQAAEFYIVQDVKTKKCTVVDKKPETKTTMIVDGNKVYTTREEAMGAVKTVKVCTTN